MRKIEGDDSITKELMKEIMDVGRRSEIVLQSAKNPIEMMKTFKVMEEFIGKNLKNTDF